MNQEMKIIKEVAQVADRGDFYTRAKTLGEIASRAFGERHRSQMTGLENIANSTLKVTDVLDFIKKQFAKSKHNEGWRKEDFGIELKKYIEQSLRKRREEICHVLENVEEESVDRQRIYLRLIREFVRQLVIHYEYQTSGGESDGSSANGASPENLLVE